MRFAAICLTLCILAMCTSTTYAGAQQGSSTRSPSFNDEPKAAQSGAADPKAAPVSAHYSVEDTPIGDLLDDPRARAILDKYIPGFSTGDQVDMARGMTLRSIQPYAPDTVTDDVLAKIQGDFAKLPPVSAPKSG